MKINFRPCLVALCLAVIGTLLSLLCCYALPLGIALLTTELSAAIVLIIRAARHKNIIQLTTFIVTIAVTSIIVAAFFAALHSTTFDNSRQTILGRATEKITWTDNDCRIVLDELTVNGESVNGRLQLTVYDADERLQAIACGYTIGVTTAITSKPIVSDSGVDANVIRSGIRYAAACNTDVDFIEVGTPNALEGARNALRTFMIESMGEQSGGIAYGMIAGDRNYIDGDIRDAYSAAGIGHILAVSGLHIGLICSVLCALLFRLPLPRNATRALVTLLLLAYVIFAGASPSAVRAFVMCFVMLWARAFGKRDSLNTLSLAAVVCLCLSPFYLFECGFLMSFSAVGGLVLFSKSITNALTRLRLPRVIANALGAALSVQLAIIPVTALFFHRFYLWSLPVNAIMLGVLSGGFMLLIAVLPLSCLPFCGVLLVPFGVGISGLTAMCVFLAALPLAQVVLQVSGSVLLLIPLAFGLSRFVMSRRKVVMNVILLGLCVVVAVCSESSIKSSSALLALGGSGLSVVFDGDDVLLIGRLGNSNITGLLDRAGVGGDAIAILTDSLDSAAAASVLEIAQLRQVLSVRVPVGADESGAITLLRAGIPVIAADAANGIVAASSGGWLLDIGGRTVYSTSGVAAPDLAASADIVRCRSVSTDTSSAARFIVDTYSALPNAKYVSYGSSYLLEL